MSGVLDWRMHIPTTAPAQTMVGTFTQPSSMPPCPGQWVNDKCMVIGPPTGAGAVQPAVEVTAFAPATPWYKNPLALGGLVLAGLAAWKLFKK